MNPYRFFQYALEAWPAWGALLIVWVIAFAAWGSIKVAWGVTFGVVAGIFGAAVLGIGWGLAESWLRDQADAWDARRRAGVPSDIPRHEGGA